MSERWATVVRPADPSDAEAIAAIGVRSWQEGFRGLVPAEVSAERAWNVDGVRRRLASAASDGRHLLVGESDGRISGFVVLGPSRDAGAARSDGEVMALFVDPAVWRRGVGRRLVAAALRRLDDDGFAVATVWTLAESDRDLAFYEALGFRRDGATQRRESFGGPPEVRLRVALRGDRTG